MKAMLVFKNRRFPMTHDLNVLNVICKSTDIIIGIEEKWLELLSAYAVAARYPGGEQSTIEDAKEAIDIAKKVRYFARTFLGLK
jgi:HEPN domain-containing protein